MALARVALEAAALLDEVAELRELRLHALAQGLRAVLELGSRAVGAFAGMNFALYWLLSLVLKIPATVAAFFTFGTAMLLVPFVANGVLLYLTNRWIKWFKIEGPIAYLYASGIITVGHVIIGIARL